MFSPLVYRLAEDILDADLSTLETGVNIRIKWTNGTVYTCKYLGRKPVLLYHIKTDHETRQMPRNEFFCDTQPPFQSDPNERDSTYSRRQPVSKGTKRKQRSRRKQKRRRIVLTTTLTNSESLWFVVRILDLSRLNGILSVFVRYPVGSMSNVAVTVVKFLSCCVCVCLSFVYR